MTDQAPKRIQDQQVTDWYESAEDQKLLLEDPEGFTTNLRASAQDLHSQGVTDDEDLREMLELVDSAFEWAVEAKV